MKQKIIPYRTLHVFLTTFTIENSLTNIPSFTFCVNFSVLFYLFNKVLHYIFVEKKANPNFKGWRFLYMELATQNVHIPTPLFFTFNVQNTLHFGGSFCYIIRTYYALSAFLPYFKSWRLQEYCGLRIRPVIYFNLGTMTFLCELISLVYPATYLEWVTLDEYII